MALIVFLLILALCVLLTPLASHALDRSLPVTTQEGSEALGAPCAPATKIEAGIAPRDEGSRAGADLA